MPQKRKSLRTEEERLREATQIENLMAAGWEQPEIAKGLGRSIATIGVRVRKASGLGFKDRQAIITVEVFDASMRAGRRADHVYKKLGIDEDGLHARIRRSRELGHVKPAEMGGSGHKIDNEKRRGTITRLMSIGLNKQEVAKGLGLSEGGFEKAYAKASDTPFRRREEDIALEVTEASVRAGRTTQHVLDQLEIDPTTLRDRLKRKGTHLGDVQDRVIRETQDHARKAIHEFLGKNGDIPEGTREHWKKIGKEEHMQLYERTYGLIVNGMGVKDLPEELGLDKGKVYELMGVVMKDAVDQRKFLSTVVHEMLEPPALSEKEHRAFYVIAVQGQPTSKAAKTLDVSPAMIIAYKRQILKKYPELKGLLRYRKDLPELED
ncbi:hypothetical protein ACFLRF_02785 [Candidatus Altiarchaeota archaeon]